MNSTQFFIELRDRFSAEEWPAVFLALKHDHWIDDKLTHTDLGLRALQSLPAVREIWSPAGLALFDIGWRDHFPHLCQGLETPLDEEMTAHAVHLYQGWIESNHELQNMAQAGYLALALFSTSHAQGLSIKELTFPASYSAAPTVLACLVGLVHDIHVAIQSWKNVYQCPSEVILHALLSNPFDKEGLNAGLQTLISFSSFDEAMRMLRQLRLSRPWLLPELARFYLHLSPDSEVAIGSEIKSLTNGEKAIQALFDWAELHTFADRPAQGVQLLKDGLQSLRSLQGEVAAQLARTVEHIQPTEGESIAAAHDTAQQAWKKACELAPHQLSYRVGLAKSYLQEGKLDEAKEILASWTANGPTQSNAHFEAVFAKVAFLSGEEDVALHHARRALDMVEKGECLEEEEAQELIEILMHAHEYDLAERFAEQALSAHPANLALIRALAEAKLSLGNPFDALIHLYHLMATESYTSAVPKFSEQIEVRELFARSLQGVGAWQAALDERLRLIHQKETPSAEDWLNLAECALRAGDIDQAHQACNHLQSIDGESLDYRYLMGEINLHKGDYPQALEHLRAVAREDPGRIAAWLGLAKAYQAQDEGEKAIESLRKAAQANPGSVQIYVALGEAYGAFNAWTQAVACLRRAAELSPSTEVLLKLAEAQYHLGNFRDVIQIMEQVAPQLRTIQDDETIAEQLVVHPGVAEMKRVAHSLLALGEHSRAIPVWEALLKAHVEDGEIRGDYVQAALKAADARHLKERTIPRILSWIGEYEQNVHKDDDTRRDLARGLRVYLAEAYAAIGDWRNAIEAYRSTMGTLDEEATTEKVRIALGFSRAAMSLGQPETAIAVLKDVIKPLPEYVPLWRMLSEAYLASNLDSESLQAAREARALEPNDVKNLLWFIEHLAAIGQVAEVDRSQIEEETLASLRQAVAVMPRRVDLLVRLCNLLINRGERGAASELLEKLPREQIDVNSVSLEGWGGLGQMLLRLGQPHQAIAFLSKVAEQNSKERLTEIDQQALAQIWETMAQAHVLIGQWPQALEAVEAALALMPHRFEAQMIQAEVLHGLGRTDEALSLLRSLMRQSQDRGADELRLAQLLYKCQAPMEALHLIEQTIVKNHRGPTLEIAQKGRLWAARIAHSLLQPEKALAYLEEEEINRQSPVESFLAPFCLQVEIAFELGTYQGFEDALRAFLKAHPKHVHLLCVASRSAWYRGDKQEAQELYNQAVQITYGDADSLTRDKCFSEGEGIWPLLSLARTSQTLGYAHQAIEWAKQAQQLAPWMPLAHFALVQILVEQAEQQRLCEDLYIIAHAPGKEVLSKVRYSEFEAGVHNVEELLTHFVQQAPQGFADQRLFEASKGYLRRWRSRGRVAFHGDAAALQSLEQALLEGLVDAPGFASLLMGYRSITAEGERAATVEAMWQKHAKEPMIRDHPLVRLQVALGLMTQSPIQACQVLQEVIGEAQFAEKGNFQDRVLLRACLALCAFRAGEYNLAFKAIQEALNTWPEEPRWHAFAAEIYLAMDTQGSLRENSKALIHLEQAINLEPDYAGHYLAIGKVYQQRGDVLKARSAFERAAELESGCAEPWMALAELHMHAREWPRAIACADKAVELSQGGRESRLLRGEIGLQSGDAQTAMIQAQKVLNQHKDDAQALQLKARALEALGNADEALEVIKAASYGKMDDLAVQLERVKMLRRVKGLEVGLTALQALAAQYEAHPSLLTLLADWLLESGKKEAALQMARRVLQDTRKAVSPKERAHLHHLIGTQMMEAGQLDQAIHHLSEAAQAEPDNLEAYLSLGKAYLQRREYKQALKVFRSAIAMAPEDYRPYFQSALALKDNKEYAEAETMLRQAAKLAPHEVSVHRLLAAIVALNLVHNRKLESTEAK